MEESKPLYAVVRGGRLVEEVLAPIEAADARQAIEAIIDTYPHLAKSTTWSVVPLTPELEEAYRNLPGRPA